MIKYIILMITPFLASNYAVAHDAVFYSLHPVELQQALEKCPQIQPTGVSCQQLNELGIHANQLVSELHYNPQVFGQKILALQETLIKLEVELKDKPDSEHLLTTVDENKMQLRERLAIVKWLESPRG